MKESVNYALVTGASSGIGLCISEFLAQKGYSIIAVSNQEPQLNDLKIRLEQAHDISVVTINADLSAEDAALRIFNYCRTNGLNVEILVNNAGIFLFGETVVAGYPESKTILNLHMVTPALLCQLFGEPMAKAKRGYILNVSSISAVMPYPGISLYGPSKAFMRYFSRAFRTEMKIYGVNVTCLIPGGTRTALYDPGKFDNAWTFRMGLLKKPETVARAAVEALFKNKAECIPGFLNKLTVLILPLVPHSVVSYIHRRTNIVKKMN